MRAKAIKRMLLTLMWIGVGIGMFVIVSAAMQAQQSGVCNGYAINIKGANSKALFTTEKDIDKLLKSAVNGPVKGMPKSGFSLVALEDLLEQSAWVYNAELYFDNTDILHVNVTERKPLARVFDRGGVSFYIDETGRHIPVSDRVSLDVPVFTGYPDKQLHKNADSVLLQNMVATASYIQNDSFWNAQVASINIEDCGDNCYKMIMSPVVGNHRVNLGDGSDIATKFHRLFLFYDQVLKKNGFDKYRTIDVQYAGQIIGIKDSLSKIDSMQLRKNITALLQQTRQANGAIADAQGIAGAVYVEPDTTTAIGSQMDTISMIAPKPPAPEPVKEEKIIPVPVVAKPAPKPAVKKAAPAKPVVKPVAKPAAAPAPKKINVLAKPATPKPQPVHPAAKPVVQKPAAPKPAPVKKPVVKPAAPVKPVAKPVAKPAAKPAAKPQPKKK